MNEKEIQRYHLMYDRLVRGLMGMGIEKGIEPFIGDDEDNISLNEVFWKLPSSAFIGLKRKKNIRESIYE